MNEDNEVRTAHSSDSDTKTEDLHSSAVKAEEQAKILLEELENEPRPHPLPPLPNTLGPSQNKMIGSLLLVSLALTVNVILLSNRVDRLENELKELTQSN